MTRRWPGFFCLQSDVLARQQAGFTDAPLPSCDRFTSYVGTEHNMKGILLWPREMIDVDKSPCPFSWPWSLEDRSRFHDVLESSGSFY